MAEAKLKAQVLQSRLVAGKWSAEPANTAVFTSRSPEKGTLYILVELVADPSRRDDLTRDLVQTLGEEYLRAPGGITHGLRQAVRAANNFLVEQNRNHPREIPAVAGVCCAVVRGRDLFLGQGGAAFAILRLGKEVRFYPPPAAKEKVAPIPLGLSEELRESEVSHAPLNGGDILVLASPAILEFAAGEELLRAMVAPRGEDLLVDLQKLARGQEVSFLVLEAKSEEAAALAPQRGISFAFLQQLQDRRFWDGVGRRMRGWGQALWRLTVQTAQEMLPGEGRARPPATRRLPVAEARQVDWRRWAILGSLAGLGLLAFILVVNFWNQRQTEEAAFRELVAQAQELVVLAGENSDPATARALLLEAAPLLEEALQSRPGDSQVLALQEEFRASWDGVHKIQRQALPVALQLESTGGGPFRLVFAKGVLYLLDGGRDEIFAYQWLPESRTLQSPASGAILIPAGDRGDLWDMAWVEEGGFRTNSALLILSAEDLLEYDPSRGISSVQLVERGNWPQPQRIAGFAGNFYVLDAEGGTVWKYFATEAGYTLSPDSWISPDEQVDLSLGVDMAIDGFIWILSGDGQLLKLDQGVRRVFELQGLLEPLLQPVALYTDPDADYLYVADGSPSPEALAAEAGSGRILVLDKQGNFIRQFRPSWEEEELFTNLQALAVAEEEGVAFVLAGGELHILEISVAGY